MGNNVFSDQSVSTGLIKQGSPALLTSDGVAIGTLILLDLQGSAESNVQIDRTFDGNFFVTSFGQKLTPWTVTGMAPRNPCDPDMQGGQAIKDFYENFNAGDNGPVSLELTFDKLSIAGILLTMAIGPYRVNDVDAYRYTLTIMGQLQR